MGPSTRSGMPDAGAVPRWYRRPRWQVALQALLMLAIVLAMVVQVFASRRAAEELLHVNRVAVDLFRLSDDLRDLETGERRYVLTGQDAWLELYYAAVRDIGARTDHLRLLTQDDPSTVRTLTHFVAARDRELDRTFRLIETRRTGDADAALTAVRAGVGNEEMDALRRDIGGLLIHWRDRRAALAIGLVAGQERLAGSVALGAVFGIALLVWTYRTQQRAASALRRSSREKQAILDGLVEGVSKQAVDGRVVAVNARAPEILGLTEDQLLGRDSGDPRWGCIREDGTPCPGDEHPPMIALRTGRPVFDLTLGVDKPDGSRRWLRVNSVPLFEDGEPAPVAVVTSFLDITQERESERALRDNEGRLRALIDNAADAIFVRDSGGRIHDVNPAACRDWGYTRDELLELGTCAVMVGASPEAAAGVGRDLEPGQSIKLSRTMTRKDGTTYPAEIHLSVFYERGERRLLNIVRDVSELQEAHRRTAEGEARLQTILDSVPAPITYWNPDRQCVFANRAATHWYGPAGGLVVGRDAPQVMGSRAAVMSEPYRLRALQGELCRFERIDHDAAGKARNVVVHYIPDATATGEILGIFALITDTTELSRAVAARTKELAQANEALRKSLRTKDEFLANASHEMRTPLHAIRSFLGLARKRLGDVPDEKIARFLGNVDESAARLSVFVEDVLLLTRLEGVEPGFDASTLRLTDIVEAVWQRHGAQLAERDQRVEIVVTTPDPVIEADAALVDQMVSRLLSNAIRFSPAGGAITVTVRDAVPGDPAAGVCLSIGDEGVGIPEDELELIFGKFEQSSRTKTGAGGKGLGLPICRAIMTLHHGAITARNGASGGAMFEAVFPRTQSGPVPLAAPA